jgi:hypothetical protein
MFIEILKSRARRFDVHQLTAVVLLSRLLSSERGLRVRIQTTSAVTLCLLRCHHQSSLALELNPTLSLPIHENSCSQYQTLVSSCILRILSPLQSDFPSRTGRNPIRRGRGVGERTEKLPLDCLANFDTLIF